MPVLASADTEYSAALAAYQRRDFKTAAVGFEKAFQQGKSTPTVLLYVGHSYAGSGQKDKALAAYGKITTLYHRSPEYALAKECMGRLDPAYRVTSPTSSGSAARTAVKLPPTTPGSPFRRWTKESFPLRVYITRGLELPEKWRGRELSNDEYSAMCNSLRTGSFERSLTTNANYGSEDSGYVSDGLRFWAGQNSVSYTETHSIADADIVVFFTDKLVRDLAGLCHYPFGVGQPNMIQMAMSEKKSFQPDAWGKTRRAVAAHEFGHAFGLEHSPTKGDLMYEKGEDLSFDNYGEYVQPKLTINDRTALQKLYANPPGHWMGTVRATK